MYDMKLLQKGSFENIVSICVGHDKVAELLIRKGADVNIVTDNGDTALIIAADKGK